MPKANKKIMRRFRISEISGVDRPAQTLATVALFKRAGGATGIGKQSGMETGQAQGHRHVIRPAGLGGSGGVQLVLESAVAENAAIPEGDTEAPEHTHPVVRGPGNTYVVGHVDGGAGSHTHTINTAQLTRDLLADGMGKDGAVLKLADGLTTEGVGHVHGLSVNVHDGRLSIWIDHATAEGAEGPHSHAVTRDASGNYVLGASAGHGHELPDMAALLAGLADPASVGKGGAPSFGALAKSLQADFPNMTPAQRARVDELLDAMTKGLSQQPARTEADKEEKYMSDQIRKREDAEAEVERLAKACASDLDITYEAAYVQVLRTSRGRELYKAMRQPIAKHAGYDEACEAAIEKLADIGQWDSEDEADDKRMDAARKYYVSEEHRRLYALHFAPAPIEKSEPELEPVQAGLLTKAEIATDPEAALDKLAVQVAWRDGCTKEKAYAGFFKRNSIGYELLKLVDAANRARSA